MPARRGQLSSVFMPLVLVIAVMIGAFVGGRTSGIVSAAVATLCSLFFTVPYRSLRISNRNDIASTVALVVVADFDRPCRVVAISAHGADVEDVVSSAPAEIMGMFDLDQCVFETTDTPTRAVPRSRRDGGWRCGQPGRSRARASPGRCRSVGHRTGTGPRSARTRDESAGAVLRDSNAGLRSRSPKSSASRSQLSRPRPTDRAMCYDAVVALSAHGTVAASAHSRSSA
jgi:hypothetical protein